MLPQQIGQLQAIFASQPITHFFRKDDAAL